MVTLPLILSDQGDVAVFETVADIERYVEPPDAAEYRIYDALGRRYFFKGYREPLGSVLVKRSQPMQLDDEHPGDQAGNDLAQLLRSYLQRVGCREPLQTWSLEQLVRETIERSGYTR